jgi:cytochrome oxidase assembly protein ShyY1
MNQQLVELSVWLGIAFLALICAGLGLWRVRRLVSRLRRGVHVSSDQLAPTALTGEAGLVRAP